MFFDGWSGLARVLIVGAAAYIGLVMLLRVSGKRTLSKMNAFDLIVTVALGSTLSSVLLSKDVALAEGLLALALLIGLQFAITWASVRWSAVNRAAKSQPALLCYDGHFLDEALLRERVTHGEVHAELRKHGYSSIAQVHAVVLETDGSLSVVTHRTLSLNDIRSPSRVAGTQPMPGATVERG